MIASCCYQGGLHPKPIACCIRDVDKNKSSLKAKTQLHYVEAHACVLQV